MSICEFFLPHVGFATFNILVLTGYEDLVSRHKYTPFIHNYH